ncbi:MAG: N(G),N(G)-dimethylarginine dimethylaminohydrolase [Actinotalea sp.]|nr:N(G),N(G)-dimethylarginine dimethylaminohydrolase [Actinotalea sp.]
MRTALVRRPSPRLAEGVVDHIERVPVDPDRAVAQWEEYVAALRAAGWDVVEVPAAPEHPDSVFVEDTVVLFRGTAVVARPGHPTRRGEERATEAVLREMGAGVVHLEEPATLDGGDVLKVGDTVYVGRSDRTNAAAVAQLRTLLEPHGATVVAVPVTTVLHLKTAVTALPDGTVIGYEPVVDAPRLFPRFLPVPEEHGTAVVDLGEGRLLMSASAPRTADLLAGLGWTPVPVDISEYEKLEGCVTCLSVRVRELPGATA